MARQFAAFFYLYKSLSVVNPDSVIGGGRRREREKVKLGVGGAEAAAANKNRAWNATHFNS